MAKTKNTPAYVKKAIEWLEKNAPEGEQIAFINEEEAAHLKAMGGSGQEAVDGVRSYQTTQDDINRILDRSGGFDADNGFFTSGPFRGQTRQQATAQVRLQQQVQQVQQEQQQQQQPTLDPVQFAPRVGGAAAIRKAEQTDPPELAIPTVPTVPTMQVADLPVTQDQLVSEEGVRVSAAPTTLDTALTTEEGAAPVAPARAPAATTTAAQVADTGEATAAQLAAPTRTIGDIQEAIPTEELAVAATGELDQRATLQFQLGEITSSIKEGQPLPLWAAPAARNADSIMLQRGLGSSSMAASARTQALLEAGIPIASADAEAYGRIQLQNISNRQATALQNANNLAALRTQNLNARLSAAVNNAKNFLTIDTSNLNNRQASNVLTFQADQQKLFSNQAAENAARQFNATSSNQVEQFFSTLENSAAQSNANRITAIRQGNNDQLNTENIFLENQRFARETFNSQASAAIRNGNANWFRSQATIENGNQMLANSFTAQATLGLRSNEYQNLWQKRRDDANFIFDSVERGLDREAQVAALAQQSALARSAQKSASKNSLLSTIGTIGAALITKASDIRLKTNIEKIGEFSPVIDLYRWEWNEVAEKLGVDNQPTVGVLAQELIEYRPDLVLTGDDGYFKVNYSGLFS